MSAYSEKELLEQLLTMVANQPNKLVPAHPLERDTMPREVACEMLTNPKVKMSNRFRKTCLDALATVTESGFPLVWSITVYFRNTAAGKSFEDKVERRVKTRTFRQLVRDLGRARRRRVKVQKLAAMIPDEAPVEFLAIRGNLDNRARLLDAVQEYIQNEIKTRTNRKTND